MDVSYFDNAFTEEPIKLTPVDRNFLDHLNQTQFKGFSYTNKQYTSWTVSSTHDHVCDILQLLHPIVIIIHETMF